MKKLSKTEHDAICRTLVDQGCPIAAGFETLRFTVIPDNAPTVQVEEMRLAFFAGAQHLFATIFAILDPGTEPTAQDLSRMDQISQELDRFLADYKARTGISEPGTIH